MVHHDECSSNNRDAETRRQGDAGTRGCEDGYRVKGIQVDGLKYKLESLSGRQGRFTPAAVG